MSSVCGKPTIKMSIIKARLKKDKKKELREAALKKHQEDQALKHQEWIKEMEKDELKPQKINRLKPELNVVDEKLVYRGSRDFPDNATKLLWEANHKRETEKLDKWVSDMYKTSMHQVGGDHYKNMKVQPWDAIHSSLDTPAFLAYLRGTAIAYLMRCQDLYQEKGKQSIEDTEKAIHTLQKYMEVAKEWLSAKP